MKKTIKKSLIAVCSLAFAMFVGVGINSVSASAATDPVAVTDNFYMSDGAAIRIKGSADPSGIRWTANVTKTYYDYITELDANAEFGILVDDNVIESNVGATIIPTTAERVFDSNDVWTYYASITYDELEAKLEEQNKTPDEIKEALKKCHEEVLWARAYVKYTTNSVETYEYAVQADVNRSIKGVAMNCLIEEQTTGNDDVTTANKDSFVSYADGEYATINSEKVAKNAYDLTNATGTVTSQDELAAGDYTVYVGAKKINKITHAGGKATATIEELGSTIAVKGEENNVRFINAAGEVYQVPFVSATHLIGSASEFNTFLGSYKGQSNADKTINPTASWYVVLTDDIVFNTGAYGVDTWTETGAKYNDMTNYGLFCGTFDGLGYKMEKPLIQGAQKYLFGAISGATFKNFAIIGGVDVRNNSGMLAYARNFANSFENIYVEANEIERSTGAVDTNGEILWAESAVSFTNSVINVTLHSTIVENKAIFGGTATVNLTNSYVITSSTYSTCTQAEKTYADNAQMYAENKANITAENGWNEYWNIDGYAFSFGNVVIVAAAKDSKATLYKTADFDVDLSSLLGGDTPEKLYVNGVETALPAGNVYAVDWDSQTLGEVSEIEVWGNGKIVVQPYMAVTHAIGNAEQMKAFLESYATTDSYVASGTKSDGWYVVLTADFDMDNYVHNINYAGGTTWSGTFNGLGHTVSNIEVRQGGLFGRLGVGAVIENTAFVGIKHIKDWYVLCNQAAGSATIRNLYLEGETTNGEAILIRGSKSGMTISNVIMNFTNSGTKVNVSIFEEKATLTNVYGIGDIDKIIYSGTATGATLYEDVTTFFNAEQANITSENGWNEYWAIREGSLYFGNTKVE